MRISEIISNSNPFASIEVVPPLKGLSREELLDSIRPFMEFRPPYINVTSHRLEYAYVQRPDGGYDRQVIRARMSCAEVCGAILDKFGVEVVPHVICAGRDKEAVKTELGLFKSIGLSNIMALRGDCTMEESRFQPFPGGYAHASELVSDASADGFCIGVGGYPEKHFEAANIDEDIANLKLKVDAGASFIITQMFFDNAVFYDFKSRCRRAGITVPIIPGLKPLTTARQLELLPQTFSIDIPGELSSELRSHSSDKAAVYAIGQEWCTAQCRDLLSHGVKAVHFYTMGKSDNVISILRSCF